jgi:hypothetical protein
MPTPVSGLPISFSDIQTEFGGDNPIGIEEYYQNAATTYTSGVAGIPNTGVIISIEMFYGKSKPAAPSSVEYMLAENRQASMSGGETTFIGSSDDSFAGIGVVGFPFFWFGTDWGSGNNVQWCTNNVLTFGGGSSQYATWAPTTGRGVLLGQADRWTNWGNQFTPTTNNNHSIKRIIVSQSDYSNRGVSIEYDIRLIRGPAYQYIEVRFGNWNSGNAGLWQVSDGGTFYNTFTAGQNTLPVSAFQSFVLRGDLNGYNWVHFPNRFVNV